MQQLIERFQKGEPMGSSGGTTPRDLVGVSLSGDLGETNDLVESLGPVSYTHLTLPTTPYV